MESKILPDHRIILDMVRDGASVLDLGCGNGDLLYMLIKLKAVRGQGIDISEEAIYQCVEKGLVVTHDDIDSGLSDYSDKSFDYVILNQSLQQVKHFETVFDEALRVGRNTIMGLPNFAYYKARLQIFFGGRAPVTSSLPYNWYDSPNEHFFSFRDFTDFCRRKGARVERAEYINETKKISVLPNLFSTTGIFLL